jgi:glucan-binding YG repeat protein
MEKKIFVRTIITVVIALAIFALPSKVYAATVTIPGTNISFDIPDDATSYSYRYVSVNTETKLTVTINGKTKYYIVQDGKLVETDKSFKPIKPEKKPTSKKNGWYNKKYYINGQIVKGWKVISGKKYYFDKKTGVVTTGLKKIGKNTYYFAKSGVLQKNRIIKISGKIRAFDKKGKMVTNASYTGKYNKKKVTYYFDANGVAIWKAV